MFNLIPLFSGCNSKELVVHVAYTDNHPHAQLINNRNAVYNHMWGHSFHRKNVSFPNKSKFVTNRMKIGDRNKDIKEKRKREL